MSSSDDSLEDKPLKRVRFSNEINFDSPPGKYCKLPLEEKSIEQNKLEESQNMDIDVLNASEYCDDKVPELIDSNKQIDVTEDFSKAESSSSYDRSYPQPTEYSNNINSDLPDLKTIIDNTKNITLYSSEEVPETQSPEAAVAPKVVYVAEHPSGQLQVLEYSSILLPHENQKEVLSLAQVQQLQIRKALMKERGINYEEPLTPMQVADKLRERNKLEREKLEREKQKNQPSGAQSLQAAVAQVHDPMVVQMAQHPSGQCQVQKKWTTVRLSHGKEASLAEGQQFQTKKSPMPIIIFGRYYDERLRRIPKPIDANRQEIIQRVEQNNPPAGLGISSSGDFNSNENILSADEQSVEQNVNVIDCKQRSSGGMFKGWQTNKLNSHLRNDNSSLNSAIDIKNAVYNAWNTVKNENAKAEKSPSLTVEVSKKTASPPHPCKVKRESRKKNLNKNVRKDTSNKAETKDLKEKDDTESKMAFRAWKKKKDELLTQQIAEKRKKEEKKRLDTLMNERMQKSDAESAYLAWAAHKAAIENVKKKRTEWRLQKEKEKLIEKSTRNEEAAKIYYKWLRYKIFSKNFMNSYHETEDKPPWTPPGKAKSLI